MSLEAEMIHLFKDYLIIQNIFNQKHTNFTPFSQANVDTYQFW